MVNANEMHFGHHVLVSMPGPTQRGETLSIRQTFHELIQQLSDHINCQKWTHLKNVIKKVMK